MKMTKFFAMALPLCVGALLAGCSDAATEEEIAPASAATTHTFTATIVNDDTRAYIGSKEEGYKVLWNKGDEMSFFPIGKTTPVKATQIGESGYPFGTFTYEGSKPASGAGCFGVYPYNANDRIDRLSIVTELSAEQTYKAGSHGGQNVYMADYVLATENDQTDLNNMQVYHSGLGVWLKGRGTGFKIIIESKVEPLAGKVRIATPYEAMPVATATAESSKKVTFTCDSELLTDEAKPFCVALLPGKYTKLRIMITDMTGSEEKAYYMKTASNITLRQRSFKMMDKKAFGALDLPMPIDHAKNPLAKWAEADLVYNKSTKTNSLASSYMVQGSLYQWGRNVGWSNHIDALGEKIKDKFWNYGTFNDFYCTGTGIYNGTDHASYIAYENANAFTEFPDIYFMDPSCTEDPYGDYWHYSFGDGGSTWNERAEKCGFNGSPCPSGYHMPTKAEFLEIKPSTPLNGSGSLAQVLNNRVELRKIEGGCTYAMRWSAETKSSKTYLRIDALVVEEDFAEADLSTIDWNDANVVTRYFGANGYIHGFYHRNIVNILGKIHYYYAGRPMPGTETHEDVPWISSDFKVYTVLWNYIKDYSVKNEGYYWMSDVKETLTFQDNTRIKTARTTNDGYPTNTYAFPDKLSVFGTLPVNAQDCCSIRCVKD